MGHRKSCRQSWLPGALTEPLNFHPWLCSVFWNEYPQLHSQFQLPSHQLEDQDALILRHFGGDLLLRKFCYWLALWVLACSAARRTGYVWPITIAIPPAKNQTRIEFGILQAAGKFPRNLRKSAKGMIRNTSTINIPRHCSRTRGLLIFYETRKTEPVHAGGFWGHSFRACIDQAWIRLPCDPQRKPEPRWHKQSIGSEWNKNQTKQRLE